jgi:hypothetical protein
VTASGGGAAAGAAAISVAISRLSHMAISPIVLTTMMPDRRAASDLPGNPDRRFGMCHRHAGGIG